MLYRCRKTNPGIEDEDRGDRNSEINQIVTSERRRALRRWCSSRIFFKRLVWTELTSTTVFRNGISTAGTPPTHTRWRR